MHPLEVSHTKETNICPTIANVSLLTVVSPDSRFLARVLPNDHRWAPGKIDLLNVELPANIGNDGNNVFLGAMNNHLQEIGLGLDRVVVDSDPIGHHRQVVYYPVRSEYRDTRRVFFSGQTQEELEELIPQGYTWLSMEDLRNIDSSTYRWPVIREALIYYAIRHIAQILQSQTFEHKPFQIREIADKAILYALLNKWEGI